MWKGEGYPDEIILTLTCHNLPVVVSYVFLTNSPQIEWEKPLTPTWFDLIPTIHGRLVFISDVNLKIPISHDVVITSPHSLPFHSVHFTCYSGVSPHYRSTIGKCFQLNLHGHDISPVHHAPITYLACCLPNLRVHAYNFITVHFVCVCVCECGTISCTPQYLQCV